MSVTFIADLPRSHAIRVEPCLCAQMAPAWAAVYRGESDDFAPLRGHADPQCRQCGGTGAEPVEQDDRPQVNFANMNARLVLQAMGLDSEDLVGRRMLPEFRRGLMRARNMAQPETLRAAETDGRHHVAGYSRADLMAAVQRLQELAERAGQLGARSIFWG